MTTLVPGRWIAGPPVRSLASAALLALIVVVPVLAHADLVSSDPPDGAVLEAPPDSITLTFSEGLDAAKSSFRLIGPDGTAGTGRAAADGATTMSLTGLALGAGTWTVQWTSAAEDGHIARGTLTFSVSQPTPSPATPTPTPATSSTAAPATPEVGTSAPTAEPSPATTDGASIEPSPAPSAPGSPADTSTGDLLLPIVAGLLIVGIVGVLVLRRSRRV